MSQSLIGRPCLVALTLALLALAVLPLSSPAQQSPPAQPVAIGEGPSIELAGAETMLRVGGSASLVVRVSGLDDSRHYYVAAIRTRDSIGRGPSCSAHWGHTDLTGRESAEIELVISSCKSGTDGIVVLLKEIQESGYGIEVATARASFTVA